MKVKHLKLKQIAEGLYLCTDSRSGSSSLDNPGGAGYVYLGFENPTLKIAANTRRLARLGHKK